MAERINRRVFLGRACWAIAGVLAAESAGALGVSLRPFLVQGGFGSKLKIGGVDEIRAIPVGTVVPFAEQRFFLSHVESGFIALYRKCTHLGCVVPWVPDEPSEDGLAKKGRFNCPCHGSMFDRFGVVHAGPAPRPLDIFPITVEGKDVWVDTGAAIQRSGFEESQARKV
ncbi:MAG: Rieske 2Fe-2S domain-containing protein [Chloroflexi bacterium]|nr:Rieske 2Fe-2S domain-containing protein [Chloroflexota bacterium]